MTALNQVHCVAPLQQQPSGGKPLAASTLFLTREKNHV